MKRPLQQLLLVAGPKIGGGVLTVVLNAVLLRFLGPAEYGVFALCIAVILLFDSIVGAAVDNTMLKLVQLDQARGAPVLQIEQGALFVKLGLWLAVAMLAMPFASLLSARWLEQERVGLVGLVLLAAGAVLVFRSLLAHCQSRSRFAAYGALDLLQIVLKFGSIAVLLRWAQQTTVEAVIALIALAPLCVVLIAAVAGALPSLRPGPSPSDVLRVAVESRWFLLTFGLSMLINRLDLYLLAELSSISAVGIYSGGQVFAMIPELLGSYLGIVYAPRIFQLWREGRLRRLGLTVLWAGIALSAAGMLVLWAGRPLLAWLFPAQFEQSVLVMLVLLPGALAAMIAFPVVIPLLMFGRPRAIFVLDLLTLPVVAALYFWLIPRYGALGAAAAASVSRVAKVAAMHALAWQLLNRSPKPPGTDLTAPA